MAAGTSIGGKRELTATGVANVDTGERLTPETVLHVASLTKPVVAASLLTVAADSVDRPVIDLVPELRECWRVSPKLTPRDLLSHRAGIKADLDQREREAVGDGPDALANAVRLVVSTPQVLRPRVAWRYGNGGYFLTGYALAQIKGESFENFLNQAVFEPVGMVRTGFEPSAGVRGHERGRTVEERYRRARRPCGGLCSNVPDLLAFAEHLLGMPAVLAAMARSNIATSDGSLYGLGLHTAGEEAKVLWHRGAWGGYRSCLLIVPQHRFAAVALANDADGDAVIDEYLRLRLAEATGLVLPRGRPSWYPKNAWQIALARATRRLPI
jgi:CubicO group peptidase (beta-lactamase class C family)